MSTKMMQDLTDEQLVLQFQSTGNNQFFSEIYNRYHKKVYHTCLGVVKDREAAYDLVQDVMIKVMESIPNLKNGFLLGFWIHRIAKNKSLDFCKERSNRSSFSTDACYYLADQVEELQNLEDKEVLLCEMERAMQELKEDERRLLRLKYFENYTVEDLQNKLSLSESAVKMRLARARKRMVNLCREDLVAHLSR